jgi:hypothetical protein
MQLLFMIICLRLGIYINIYGIQPHEMAYFNGKVDYTLSLVPKKKRDPTTVRQATEQAPTMLQTSMVCKTIGRSFPLIICSNIATNKPSQRI